MAKVAIAEHDGNTWVRYHCPACGHDHAVPAERWNWNKDVEKPTLSPSVRHFYEKDGRRVTTCHYHIREGRIEYANDCPHAFAGKKIEMEDIE